MRWIKRSHEERTVYIIYKSAISITDNWVFLDVL